MVTIIKDPEVATAQSPSCQFCNIKLSFDPSDVRQQSGCGPGGCGLFNVITCPRCQRVVRLSRVEGAKPPVIPFRR